MWKKSHFGKLSTQACLAARGAQNIAFEKILRRGPKRSVPTVEGPGPGARGLEAGGSGTGPRREGGGPRRWPGSCVPLTHLTDQGIEALGDKAPTQVTATRFCWLPGGPALCSCPTAPQPLPVRGDGGHIRARKALCQHLATGPPGSDSSGDRSGHNPWVPAHPMTY